MSTDKRRKFGYRFRDPKTGHFVRKGTPGAKRVRVRVPPPQPVRFRDSKGRFTTPQKAKRSQAAKRAAETRRKRETAKRAGVEFEGRRVTPQTRNIYFDFVISDISPESIQSGIDAALGFSELGNARVVAAWGVIEFDTDEDNFDVAGTPLEIIKGPAGIRKDAANNLSEMFLKLISQYAIENITKIMLKFSPGRERRN